MEDKEMTQNTDMHFPVGYIDFHAVEAFNFQLNRFYSQGVFGKEELMEIAKNCQLIALDAGCEKVSAYIKVIARRDGDILSIDEKIGKYQDR